MSGAPRFLVSLLAALAVCTASGAHWMLLQSIAWVGMVAVYAQDRPLSDAVSDTLSGEKPCPMCKAIAAEKKKEQEKQRDGAPVGFAAKKLMLALVEAGPAPEPGSLPFAHAPQRFDGSVRPHAPPVPPPRAA